MKRAVKRATVQAIAGTMLVFAAVQTLPARRTNPPIVPERTIQANLNVPEPVERILAKACADCHSSSTKWPWYSRLKPLAWMMSHDVARARRALNLSEWSVGAGRSPGQAAGTLVAACADLQSGRMPLRGYIALHPEARLPASEVRTFCDWTAQESQRLVQRKRVQDRKLAMVRREGNQ
jgi:hypothetical protein